MESHSEFRQAQIRYLMASRAVRSFGMGTVAIILPLLLAHSHLTAIQAGAVITAASVGSAVTLFAAGILGDRLGRRPVLIGISLVAGLSAALFGLVQVDWAFLLFAFLGSLARGGNAGSGGAMGPFAPVEQPLVAELTGRERRSDVLARMSFVGVLGGAAGSVVAALPDLLRTFGLAITTGEGITMVIAGITMVIAGILVLPIRESPPIPLLRSERALSPKGRHATFLLSITNSVNGFGVGFLGPFLTYWLTRRFDASATQLALLFTVTNLVTALPYLGAARIAARVGGVRMVVWTRLTAAFLTAVVALSPTFLVAGAVYLLRMIFQTVSNPIRQSLVLEMVRPEERSRVSAISTLPSQVTMSVSPAIGGFLMLSAATEDFPILGAALFQGLNALLFRWFFHDVPDPDRKQGPDTNRSTNPGQS